MTTNYQYFPLNVINKVFSKAGIENSTQIHNTNPILSPSTSSSSSRRLHIEEECNERYILIWLDAYCEENSLDVLRTKALFRKLNDRCLFLNNVDLFLNQIELIKNENKNILLIVSGSYAKEILSKTKEILSTIIIYCHEKTKYKYLLKNHSNIIDICTEYETLTICIQNLIPSLKFNLFDNQKLNSLRSLNDQRSDTYFSYMLFINFLKKIPRTEQAKDIMLNKCKDYYRRNVPYLEDIEMFRKNYTPSQAIDWYKKDTFVYRLVNRAFRTEDVALWYLFRLYIIDLSTQIETVYKKQNIQSNLTLYRGQARLSIEELENLKSNIGGIVSTNGFLSVSKDLDIARSFILGAINTDEYKVVIFEIVLNASHLKNIMFVDIDQYTGKLYEAEILFNINSVFEILNVYYDEELTVWKIEMKATDKGTDLIQERIDIMQKKFQNGNINLLFGRLLLDIEQYTKAESYFKMMLNVSSKSHVDLEIIYEHLGDLNMQITNWNEALKYFTLAYEIKIKKLPLNHSDLGITLNNLGNYYKAIEDYDQAYEYYSKALICENNSYNRAVTLLNISSIFLWKKEYQNAFDLSLEAREMFEEYSSSSYIPIIQCQGIIGSIYLGQKDYDIAEEFFLTAYHMSIKHLFIDHRYQITCIKGLINLYKEQYFQEKAIQFCQEKLNIYRQNLTDNHINIAYLFILLGDLYNDDNQEEKINSLEKALNILQDNIYPQYVKTAECLIMIGNYYQKQGLYDKAKSYYRRTLSIQKKIYPNDHFILNKTQDLINQIEN